jgi:hypothetical protein
VMLTSANRESQGDCRLLCPPPTQEHASLIGRSLQNEGS